MEKGTIVTVANGGETGTLDSSTEDRNGVTFDNPKSRVDVNPGDLVNYIRTTVQKGNPPESEEIRILLGKNG